MANVNIVILAGNLTRDPQVRFLANEKQVANFSLAINRKFKGADGELKEEVTFVEVECWGRTAELVGQYLTKGRQCLVEGRLKLESWDDKTSGQKRSKLVVVADQVNFIGGAPGQGQGGAGGQGGGERVGGASQVSRGASQYGDDQSAPSGTSAPQSRPRQAAPQPPPDDEPPF